MGKILDVNHHKSANKHTKNKTGRTNRPQPLKVVYITNPIKFKASASEFRALVQELTGQDADMPETVEFPVTDDGGEEAVAADEEEKVHSLLGQEVNDHSSNNANHGLVQRHDDPSNGHDHQVVQRGLDPSVIGAYNERLFCAPQMMEDLTGLVDSNLWA